MTAIYFNKNQGKYSEKLHKGEWPRKIALKVDMGITAILKVGGFTEERWPHNSNQRIQNQRKDTALPKDWETNIYS